MNRPTDPFRQMQMLTERVREAMAMQRRRRVARPAAWQPPMDLRATEQAYFVTFDVPGAPRETLQAEAEEGIVRVRGEVRPPADLGDARRVRIERAGGRFSRAVRLPSDADTTNTSARLHTGVLEIRVERRHGGGRIEKEIEE